MQANVLTLTQTSFPIDYFDRAWSDEARKLRENENKVFDHDPSISLGERYKEAKNALHCAYEETLKDDWDGYGAERVQKASVAQALDFLKLLPTTVPLPEISVDPDGEISLTWQREPRLVFSVSISKDGVLSYAGLFGRSKTHGVEDFIQTIPKTITDNLQRLYSTK